MPKKQVLIVGRTRMGNSGRICVGALTKDGESIRLMDGFCRSSLAIQSPYQLDEIWEVQYEPCGEHRSPHVEDVAVTSSTKIGCLQNGIDEIKDRLTIWTGDMRVLFGGLIRFTSNGSAYISPAAVPPFATGFWRTKKDLLLENDGNAIHYVQDGHFRLKYVGFQTLVPTIVAGTLVRVSLARWWKPDDADDNFEERCYGQLSGWY